MTGTNLSHEMRGKAGALARPALNGGAAPVLVVGGSGFIGSNLADSYLADGEDVIVLDNLSRAGVEKNLDWLKERHGARVHPVITDIRDWAAITPAFADARAIFHFAAQTAVTTSLSQPREDFEVNALGTLNVLEAARKAGRNAPVIFASTNKVYGALGDIEIAKARDQYLPTDEAIRLHGIGEDRPLDFCTPYGCSKGAADQYVLDYATSFGLPTAVLRMSCIYGPRQFGTEDQGWVAHFLMRAIAGGTITLYGDGRQVRDVLHVGDAVAAYRSVLESIERLAGRAFNLGGGPENAVSLLSLLSEIEALLGHPVPREHRAWRPGDQLYYVSDTRSLGDAIGWRPRIGWRPGLSDLCDWIRDNCPDRAEMQHRRGVA
ncbi:NAD-dependent epimerase/dehydratase family protein [Mycoplana dimorpha]|uniref:CDP-paratose 2-epimerase n=1 Tax=Mycoplana dimorpha TaxID=28320 RepID=A0A2T5BAZ2_MYCDI|nr:NAD-dependent epimerase/dehydratase family protein [Mycoplana dimorpha]PTM96145.1 CDP-paratose 2-epimerase [Mycoplana dimorpha]